MSLNPENELRTSKRLSVLLKGNYRIWESEFPFKVMTAVNISETGVCFASDGTISPGSLIELNITLPDNVRLTLLVKAVWSMPLKESSLFRTGLKILDTRSKDFQKFRAFYEERLLYPPEIK